MGHEIYRRGGEGWSYTAEAGAAGLVARRLAIGQGHLPSASGRPACELGKQGVPEVAVGFA